MAAVTGAVGNLVTKLGEVLKEEHRYNLTKSVKEEITLLLEELERAQAVLRRMQDMPEDQPEEAKRWAEDERTQSYHIVGIVEKFQVHFRSMTPDPPGDFIAKMKFRWTTDKACRQFAGEIRNVRHLHQEARERLARYQIDPIFLPRLPDPQGESGNGVGIQLATADMLTEEVICKMPRWVEDDVRFLKKELQSMEFALHKIAGVPVDQLDEGIKAWAEDMKEEYSIMQTALGILGAPTADPPAGLKGSISLKLTTAKARRQFASQIRDLKNSILEVGERRQRYSYELQIPRRTSDKPQDSDSIVGIDGHLEALVKLLTDEGSTSDRQLKLASIVGPAGVGKTTLAKQVYQSLKPQFQCTAWVSLPTRLEMKSVLSELLRQLSKDYQHVDINDMKNKNSEDNDESDLIDKIREALENPRKEREAHEKKRYKNSRKEREAHEKKRYFVVVEDVWDSSAWEILRPAFIDKNGSVVLTTSRQVDIAEYVGGVYPLSPLSEIDSTTLFYKRLFHSEDKCSPEQTQMCRKFIHECGGIPLAIISKAGLLASNPWTVKDGHALHGPYGMRRIFGISYSDLPPHLKPCLLYLSMFQKGYTIGAESLVWMWIAEGFIQETQGISLKKVGESYLNELINRYLVEPVEVDAGGKVLSCRVYNMVHEFIVSLSSEENFVTIFDGRQCRSLPETVHLLSIQGYNVVEYPLPQMGVSHVRSLVISGDVDLMHATPLTGFQELRVLDLGGCSDSLQNDHLKGVGSPLFLKYLKVGGKCITEIPKEIGNLSFLQTLDLRATSAKELTASVFLLRQLKCLYVNSRTKVPDGIRKMDALEELGDINLSKPELLKELCSLTNLMALGIAIWSWDESYDDALLELLRSLVGGIQNLQCLSILTCCSLHFLDRLDAEQAPRRLQKLEIWHSTFLTLPRWICSLENIFSLSIEVYKLTQDMIGMLGKLHTLCSLSLTSKHAPEGRFGNCTDEFRNLTSFHFLSNAMGNIFEPEAMLKLKRLKLSFQASRTKDVFQGFGFGLENLSSLEHICVEIICLDACCQVVKDAEAAIGETINRGRSRRAKLEILRVSEEDMVENEEDVADCNIKQEEQKETKKKKKMRKVRVAAKKFRPKEKGVARKYKIVSVHLGSQTLTLQAL